MIRDWAGRKPLRLDPQRVGLLLVDLQEEQRSDPNYAAHGMETVLANAQALLGAARLNGIAVFHSAYVRDFSIVPPRPFEPKSADGRATFSDGNDPGTAICREVAPVAGETLSIKNDASAFHGTALQDALQARHIEWLMVCGVWTEACVAATLRDAIALGFRVLLVKDACGSGSPVMHQTAVLNLANRLYGGGVADTERAITLLSGEEAGIWRTEKPVPVLFTAASLAADYAAL